MKIFQKGLLTALALLGCLTPAIAEDYGLPANIQDGNILHCFNWSANTIKAALPEIAAAGFGTVQMSPLQRPDTKATGSEWHNLYRPYDLSFKSSSFCTETDLKELCAEAEKYGIKVIVDVVANHVDKTSGYHDPWWDSNNRVRWEGGIDYGNRYSITHGQLGDYGDVNSELSEVCAKGKAYVEKLKSLGVKGCRWDAAKHIGLPSEQCAFWSTIASVSGMWHYGEILDNPGPNASIIKEYTNYMSVTDNRYSNGAAKNNGGIYNGYGGDWAVNQNIPANKLVYWAESHDTYSNDEWSQNVDQSIIDRAYACIACRNGATALYLARPNVKGFGNIKTGKGSTAFTSKHIAAVNAFRNKAGSQPDYCTSTGSAFSVTRQDFGAVIVMKGSGNISITNGGGYCPVGTYTDKVSGNKFTVTATTISGNVGSSGIAVLFEGSFEHGGDDPDPPVPPVPGSGDYWVLGNLPGTAGWSTTPGTGFKMTGSDGKYVAKGIKFEAPADATVCYFNITDYVGADWDDLNMNANRYGSASEGEAVNVGSTTNIVKYANNVDASGCLSWTIPAGTYDITADFNTMKLSVAKVGGGDDPTPPTPGTLTINGDYNLAYSGSKSMVYYWGGSEEANWPGVTMSTATGSDGKTYKVSKLPQGTTNVIFNNGGNDSQTADLVYTPGVVHDDNGPTSTAVVFKNGGNDDPVPPTPGDKVYVFVDGWDNVHLYIYKDELHEVAAWPGVQLSKDSATGYWKYEVPAGFTESRVIVNTGVDGYNRHPADKEPGMELNNKTMIFRTGTTVWEEYAYSGLTDVEAAPALDVEAEYYNLQGVRVLNPTAGLYIVRRGNTVTKVYVK